MKSILKTTKFKYKFADEDAAKSSKRFVKNVGGKEKFDALKAAFERGIK